MIKTVSKIGNSQGIIFDAALMELAHLKQGDELNLEVHEGGTHFLHLLDPDRYAERVRTWIGALSSDH